MCYLVIHRHSGFYSAFEVSRLNILMRIGRQFFGYHLADYARTGNSIPNMLMYSTSIVQNMNWYQ